MTSKKSITTISHQWLINNTKRLGHGSAQFYLAFKNPSTSFTPDALGAITDTIATDPLGLVCAVCVANYSVWGANNGKLPSVKAARVDVALLAGALHNNGVMANQQTIIGDHLVASIDNHIQTLWDNGALTPDDFDTGIKAFINRGV